jgi:predicted nucleic acid-binding protein
VDLLICATAARHDLVGLHDDRDFATAARFLDSVGERNVHMLPRRT